MSDNIKKQKRIIAEESGYSAVSPVHDQRLLQWQHGYLTGMQACVFVHDGCRKIQRGAQKAAE